MRLNSFLARTEATQIELIWEHVIEEYMGALEKGNNSGAKKIT
jgi:hypothetical protein